MTIGELIARLESANPDVNVDFDFGGVYPTTVDSWRGIYAEAAIGFSRGDYGGGHVTVKELLAELKQSIAGRVYSGWKGGEFAYCAATPLHVDNPGNCTDTEIDRVEIKDWKVTLYTRRAE